MGRGATYVFSISQHKVPSRPEGLQMLDPVAKTPPLKMFCLPQKTGEWGRIHTNKRLICCLYVAPIEGYDVPADAQLAVDLAALGLLSVLLQLFWVGVGSRLLFRLWQILEVKLVNLDGHPANGDGRTL